MRAKILERVFHNRTNRPAVDSYGFVVLPGRSRVRTPECQCAVPCKSYVCRGCETLRPWCCGGSPDVRCDYCVTGHAPAAELR